MKAPRKVETRSFIRDVIDFEVKGRRCIPSEAPTNEGTGTPPRNWLIASPTGESAPGPVSCGPLMGAWTQIGP